MEQVQATKRARGMLTAIAQVERSFNSEEALHTQEFLTMLAQLALMYKDLDGGERAIVHEVVNRTAVLDIDNAERGSSVDAAYFIALFRDKHQFIALPLRRGGVFRSKFVNGKSIFTVTETRHLCELPKYQSGNMSVATFANRLDVAVGKQSTMIFEIDLVIDEKSFVGEGTREGRRIFFELSNLGATIFKDPENGESKLLLSGYEWFNWLNLVFFGADPTVPVTLAMRDLLIGLIGKKALPIDGFFKQINRNLVVFDSVKGLVEDDIDYATPASFPDVEILDVAGQFYEFNINTLAKENDRFDDKAEAEKGLTDFLKNWWHDIMHLDDVNGYYLVAIDENTRPVYHVNTGSSLKYYACKPVYF